MKLYFSPEAISLAPHIILVEAGFEFELAKVNLTTMETSDGLSYSIINPNRYVPSLVLDDGKILTEAPAMLQYFADLKPEYELAPPAGEWMRVELWEAFNFLSNELHALCIPLFMPEIPDEVKRMLVEKLKKGLDYVEFKMKYRTYILGEKFTIVDAFAYPILDWMPRFMVDLQQWPKLSTLMELLKERPSIVKAQADEAAFPFF